jgi:hypothetical protein
MREKERAREREREREGIHTYIHNAQFVALCDVTAASAVAS